MSVEAMAWALTVPVGGNAKVVLLGLANHAHPDGTDSYPALDTLAGYAHCDRSTARRNLRRLEEDGWVKRTGIGPRGQTCWSLCFERGGVLQRVAKRGGGTSASEGVAPAPPEPSIEPSLTSTTTPSLRSVVDVDVEREPSLRSDSLYLRLCQHLGERIRENDPKAKLAVESKAWLTDMRLLLAERGGDTAYDEIEHVIDLCQADEFWRANVLSPAKLRKHFTRLSLLQHENGARPARAAVLQRQDAYMSAPEYEGRR